MSLDYKSSIADAGDIDTLCSNDYVNIPGKVAGEETPEIPSLNWSLNFIGDGSTHSCSGKMELILRAAKVVAATIQPRPKFMKLFRL